MNEKKYIEENFSKLIINIPEDYTPEFYNKAINNIDFDIVSKGDKLLLHSYNLFSRLLFLYNFNKTVSVHPTGSVLINNG